MYFSTLPLLVDVCQYRRSSISGLDRTDGRDLPLPPVTATHVVECCRPLALGAVKVKVGLWVYTELKRRRGATSVLGAP
jgi:hypothetical protein